MSLNQKELKLFSRFDSAKGIFGDSHITKRYLSDMHECFYDSRAREQALAKGNPLIYTVATKEFGSGEGDLHYGIGTLYPGMIGDEYFMTKGHLHEWRAAAEVYVGLEGKGMMLLQDEATGQSTLVPLEANSVVYVPGHTAHRTMNVSDLPLVYLGVYPARAGHDYKTIANRNFESVVVQRDGKPCLVARATL